MGSPYVEERITLTDGRELTYRRQLSSDEFGRQLAKGEPVDGWCDGVPLTDDQLRDLLG
ncbi:MAG TPA: hypothetical protein VJM33_12780 [Microthrixaceae bacterium]|nr:hypothetical protein [Microthrixaceae bacterium]